MKSIRMLIVGALTVLAICVFAQNSAKDPAKPKTNSKNNDGQYKIHLPNAH